MARPAAALRSMAHRLHMLEPVVEEWRLGQGFEGDAGHGDDAFERRVRRSGQHRGAGAQAWRRCEKNGKQAIGRSRGGLTTKIHGVSGSERLPLCLCLSPGNSHDAPVGRELIRKYRPKVDYLLMDKAYEDDRTRQVVAECGYVAVVPPKSNRKEPWDYDEELYQRRNEVERMFGLMKEQHRVAMRYDKLDVTYLSFVYLAFIRIALKDAMGA